MKVLAVDPGGTTGYCEADILNLPDKAGMVCIAHPFQAVDDVGAFWDRLAATKPRFIIMEDFEFRQRTRAGLDLTPKELIGVAKLYELKAPAQYQVGLYMQKASQGKSYYTDTLLKKYSFYKRGLTHGMDAMRHLLQWLTFGAGYQYLGKKKIEEFVTVEF